MVARVFASGLEAEEQAAPTRPSRAAVWCRRRPVALQRRVSPPNSVVARVSPSGLKAPALAPSESRGGVQPVRVAGVAGVPQLFCAVPSPGGQDGAAGGEGHCVHMVAAPGEGGEFAGAAGCSDVPRPGSAIVTAGRRSTAVRTDRHRADGVGVISSTSLRLSPAGMFDSRLRQVGVPIRGSRSRLDSSPAASAFVVCCGSAAPGRRASQGECGGCDGGEREGGEQPWVAAECPGQRRPGEGCQG